MLMPQSDFWPFLQGKTIEHVELTEGSSLVRTFQYTYSLNK